MKTIILKIFAILFVSITSASLYSQCFMERHNTTWHDGWISCEKKTSPNSLRGNSHWLMYSLGHRYVLGKSYWWNHNVPESLNDGVSEVVIDYSLDGVTWQEYGKLSLQKASGLKYYEGEEGPNFSGIEARYILITVLDNFGGSCAAISEVKIDVDLSTKSNDLLSDGHCINTQVYPNPFSQVVNIKLQSTCKIQKTSVFLEDALGKRVTKIYTATSNELVQLNTSQIPAGIYFAVVDADGTRTQHKVIKVD